MKGGKSNETSAKMENKVRKNRHRKGKKCILDQTKYAESKCMALNKIKVFLALILNEVRESQSVAAKAAALLDEGATTAMAMAKAKAPSNLPSFSAKGSVFRSKSTWVYQSRRVPSNQELSVCPLRGTHTAKISKVVRKLLYFGLESRPAGC